MKFANARKYLCLSFGAASILASTSAEAQVGNGPGTVIFFDFFFSDNLGIPADNFNQFIQWNVTGGSVDLVGGFGPGVFGAPPNDPLGRYVDLGGSTNNPGLFSTRLPLDLLSGAEYELSFMYRSTLPGQLNSATVTFGGKAFDVSTNTETFNQFSQRFTVNSIASSSIAFQGLKSDTDNNGIGIDGVVLRLTGLPGGGIPADPGLPIPSPVPEPASWAMMILGMGAVGGALRRRSKVSTTVKFA